MQVVSKRVLHQGLTQCPTWVHQEGEGFGPPLFWASITASATLHTFQPKNGVTRGVMPKLGSVWCATKVPDSL
jgi:hypothetical protein